MPRFQLLVLSGIPWDFLWQRPQAVASEFAKRGHRVIYVEPMETLFKDRPLNRGALSSSIRHMADNLEILSLPAGIPTISGHPRWLLRKKFHWAGNTIARHLLPDVPIVALVANPSHWQLLLRHNGINIDVLCYDCLDDFKNLESSKRASIEIAEDEKLLVDQANPIFASARALVERLPIDKVNYVPNGVDNELIEAKRNHSLSLEAIPSPRVGFLGAIWNWIDVDLICKAAKLYKEYSFVLIGPVRDTNVDELKSLPNVYFLGTIGKEDVTAHIDAFNIGINPFRDLELAETVSPVKIFAYLARGIPVVTTDMPEIRELGGVVYSASSDAEFIDMIKIAIEEDSTERQQERIQFAKDNTWSRRVDIMEREIVKVLEKKSL